MDYEGISSNSINSILTLPSPCPISYKMLSFETVSYEPWIEVNLTRKHQIFPLKKYYSPPEEVDSVLSFSSCPTVSSSFSPSAPHFPRLIIYAKNVKNKII